MILYRRHSLIMETDRIKFHYILLENGGEVLEAELLWDQVNCTLKLFEVTELEGPGTWATGAASKIQARTKRGDLNDIWVCQACQRLNRSFKTRFTAFRGVVNRIVNNRSPKK